MENIKIKNTKNSKSGELYTPSVLLDELPDALVNVFWNNTEEEIKETKNLLSRLPKALVDKKLEKWQRDKADAAQIMTDLRAAVDHREKENLPVIKGYHVSNRQLKVGSYLNPGDDGYVHYSDNIKLLYGKPACGWIYVVEGSPGDKIIDDAFGWRTNGRPMKIIGKIPLDEKTKKKYGWDFAPCEYH